MLIPASLTPQMIARRIPNCPRCGCCDYCYWYDNTEHGFYLRDMSCEACGADLIGWFRRFGGEMPAGQHYHGRHFLLLILGALAVWMVIVDGLL